MPKEQKAKSKEGQPVIVKVQPNGRTTIGLSITKSHYSSGYAVRYISRDGSVTFKPHKIDG